MDPPDRASATAAAANLVLASLHRVVRDAQASERALSAAILPVFGIRWSVEVIRRIGSTQVAGSRYINNLLLLLRNSKLKIADYNRVSQLWVNAFFNDPTSFPDSWESWRSLIERFDLDDILSLRDWTPVVQWCVNQGIREPDHLASLCRPQLDNLSTGEDFADRLVQLWRSAVLTFSTTATGTSNAVRFQSESVESLLNLIKGASLSTSGAAQRVTLACQRLNVDQGFFKLAPSQKMKLLRAKSVPQKTLNTFFKRQSQLIALTGVRKVFPSFASGIRSYFAFCELRAVRPFPVQEHVIIEWSSVFRVGACYSNYIGYVKKVCFFLNEPVDWDTAAVRNVVKALKLSGKSNFRFPNFLRSPEVISILRHEGANSEFGLLAYVAYLFALRVPSEALPLRRAFTKDCLDDFLPMTKRTAVLGIRGAPPNESLILRLASRKNLPAGCILRRPCFCTLSKVLAHALCPVHFFWPAVRRRCPSGELLFPSITRRNVNEILRAILKKIELPYAERFSSHAFRRGAASELQSSGSQWSTVATLGDWRSLAFKGYVD